MNGQIEWFTNEDLPKAFVEWLKERILEQWIEQKKGVVQIADEIGVKPAHFSRILGGKGPLKQNDIHALAYYFGLGVYTLLGIDHPDNQNQV